MKFSLYSKKNVLDEMQGFHLDKDTTPFPR